MKSLIVKCVKKINKTEIEKGYKKGEKYTVEAIKQSGLEIVASMRGQNLKYVVKLKGTRNFVEIFPEYVAFMKKNLI